jgi:hypothetical protein
VRKMSDMHLNDSMGSPYILDLDCLLQLLHTIIIDLMYTVQIYSFR